MKFLKFIYEEYYGLYQKEVVILKNPGKKELIDYKKEFFQFYAPHFRFLVDFENENVYVWHFKILHSDIIENFLEKEGIRYHDFKSAKFFMGEAVLKDMKLEITDSDTIKYAINIEKIIIEHVKNDNWSKKYFTKYAAKEMLRLFRSRKWH